MKSLTTSAFPSTGYTNSAGANGGPRPEQPTIDCWVVQVMLDGKNTWACAREAAKAENAGSLPAPEGVGEVCGAGHRATTRKHPSPSATPKRARKVQGRVQHGGARTQCQAHRRPRHVRPLRPHDKPHLRTNSPDSPVAPWYYWPCRPRVRRHGRRLDGARLTPPSASSGGPRGEPGPIAAGLPTR